MNCKGDFIFKSIEKRDGGEFTNNNGQVIKYNSSYVIKADEQTDKGIFERTFKIPTSAEVLAETLKALDPYSKVVFNFDVELFSNRVVLQLSGIDFN